MKNEVKNYGYYSKVLNKPFDSLEELEAAEREKEESDNAALKKVEEKKARAKEVEVAYQEYLDVRAEAKKIIEEAKDKASVLIKEAEDKYYNLRNKFVDDYKSFHQSYFNDGQKEIVSVSDLVNSVFDSFFRF